MPDPFGVGEPMRQIIGWTITIIRIIVGCARPAGRSADQVEEAPDDVGEA